MILFLNIGSVCLIDHIFLKAGYYLLNNYMDTICVAMDIFITTYLNKSVCE